MSYVPKYLEFQPRQADGWPQGISEESKAWCVERIEVRMSLRWANGVPWIDLEDARLAIFDRHSVPDIPEDLRNKALYDYMYAVAHRALLAAKMEQVWTRPG